MKTSRLQYATNSIQLSLTLLPSIHGKPNLRFTTLDNELWNDLEQPTFGEAVGRQSFSSCTEHVVAIKNDLVRYSPAS